MREILFRGKRVDNGEWVEGCLSLHLIDGDLSRKQKKAFITYDAMDDYGKVYRYTYEVIPETVGEYTCIEDKNGKRIFEGDIVLCESGDKKDYLDYRVLEGVVEYQTPFWAIEGNYLWHSAERLEVIGNIHDKEGK